MKGYKPHLRRVFNNFLKCSFGKEPLCLIPWGGLFQSSKVFLHTFLRGANQATSSGCKRCVALGYKQTKAMLFWEHAVITASLRCEERLSPIKTFLHSRQCNYGSVNVVSSNQPLWDQLYLAPRGLPSTHWP